jgi:hypothetical protein
MELKKQQACPRSSRRARAPLPVRACLSENARRQARTQTGKKQSPSAKQLLDQKLAITDHQIDALVCELYGLTEAEIRVISGTANSSRPADGRKEK